jgi:hypothetical protein
MNKSVCVAAVVLLAGRAYGDIFPTLPHANNNVIPFGNNQQCTHHQVVASSLFSSATNGARARIDRIAFAPAVNGSYSADVIIRMGYTTRTPGAAAGSGGLDVPIIGSPGQPNAAGPMLEFYSNPSYVATFGGVANTNFQMVFDGTPFVYDPAQGNLLVEIVTNTAPSPNIDLSVSRAAGSAESSRSYAGNRFTGASPVTALRIDFTFVALTGGCYANCDESTVSPVLNVGDFTCFLQRFAAGESYANCDESTVAPVLNVGDFTCFLQRFAAGCP